MNIHVGYFLAKALLCALFASFAPPADAATLLTVATGSLAAAGLFALPWLR